MKLKRRPILTYISFLIVARAVSVISGVLLVVALALLVKYYVGILLDSRFSYFEIVLVLLCSISSILLDKKKWSIATWSSSLQRRAWAQWQEKNIEWAGQVGGLFQEISGQMVSVYEQFSLIAQDENPKEVWSRHTIVVSKCYDCGITVSIAMRGNSRSVHIEYPITKSALVKDAVDTMQSAGGGDCTFTFRKRWLPKKKFWL